MIRWTGLAPLDFEFPFPGSLASPFLSGKNLVGVRAGIGRRCLFLRVFGIAFGTGPVSGVELRDLIRTSCPVEYDLTTKVTT
jgi:hypothetical protein